MSVVDELLLKHSMFVSWVKELLTEYEADPEATSESSQNTGLLRTLANILLGYLKKITDIDLTKEFVVEDKKSEVTQLKEAFIERIKILIQKGEVKEGEDLKAINFFKIIITEALSVIVINVLASEPNQTQDVYRNKLDAGQLSKRLHLVFKKKLEKDVRPWYKPLRFFKRPDLVFPFGLRSEAIPKETNPQDFIRFFYLASVNELSVLVEVYAHKNQLINGALKDSENTTVMKAISNYLHGEGHANRKTLPGNSILN